MDVNAFYNLDQRLQLRALWFGLGCLLLSGIVFFSLSSIMPTADILHFDKYIHISSYWILTLWWLQLYQHRCMRIALAILFVTIGAGIEFAQSFHPLRYFDVKDMAANAVGVIIACTMVYLIKQNFLIEIEKLFLKKDN